MIHRLRPSAVARRLVDVLRKRRAPRVSARKPHACGQRALIQGAALQCAKPVQGESTPTVKSLLSYRGRWVTYTLGLRRRMSSDAPATEPDWKEAVSHRLSSFGLPSYGDDVA